MFSYNVINHDCKEGDEVAPSITAFCTLKKFDSEESATREMNDHMFVLTV